MILGMSVADRYCFRGLSFGHRAPEVAATNEPEHQ